MKAAILLSIFLLAAGTPLQNSTKSNGDDEPLMNQVMRMKEREWEKCAEEHHCPTDVPSITDGEVPCVKGMAGEYECSNVDLLSFVSWKDLGCGKDLSDIWGWTDPETGKEYAIVGCFDGTSFVDVSEPESPVVLGFVKTHGDTPGSTWRDIKVYANHAFIVSEASNHGMQVVDLTLLRNGKIDPGYKPGHYDGMGNTHNIVSNEETGFMYAVGTRSKCEGGLHMIDVREPSKPKFAGCFSQDKYVHDAQCVIYKGPDEEYQGREICFCYNENTLTIVDVENKDEPVMLSRTSYNGHQYTHQGWLNEEQTHLLLNDELDEKYGTSGPNGTTGQKTRSMVWNVENLKDPELTGDFISSEKAVDHNLYIKGKLAYESNYCAGLRILDISTISDKPPKLEEVGFFDVDPDCNDTPDFYGAWSSYVYFDSPTIIVSSIRRGLFVLKYTGTVPE